MSTKKPDLKQRSVRYLLTSLLSLVALHQSVSASESLPRILVYITVEDLRGDYLEQLRPLFAQEGLGWMMTEGRVYPQVSFPLSGLNESSAVATLHTGAYPVTHGIEARMAYNAKEHTYRHVYHDPTVLGNYTRDSYSPKALLVNTLGDRLKEASAGASIVYAVGVNAEAAIPAAGWFGNGAFWIDEKIGSWATSSYYEPMPRSLEAYNRSADGPNKRLVSGQMLWTPLRSYVKPREAWSDWGQRFSHRYQGTDTRAYKHSALANEEVTQLALRLLDQAGYAESKYPGMLALSYTLNVAPPTSNSELTAEEVDAYVRLDANVQALVKELNRKFGAGNYLMALTGTGYTHYRRPSLRRAEERYGRFSHKKASALLNLYLSAIYGQGNWVERFADGRVTLNHKLAESKRLEIDKLQERAAAFLEEMEGVAMALPGERLISQSSLSPEAMAKRLSVHNRYLADIYLELTPGWTVEDSADSPNMQLVSTAIESPFILLGAGIDAKTFDYPVTAAPDIVKAIARVLRIRPPNAAR